MSYTQHQVIVVTIDCGEAEDVLKKWINNLTEAERRFFVWNYGAGSGYYTSLICQWHNRVMGGDDFGDRFIAFIKGMEDHVDWIAVSYGELGRGWIGDAGRAKYKFEDKDKWEYLLVTGKRISYIHPQDGTSLEGMIVRKEKYDDGSCTYGVKPSNAHRIDTITQDKIYEVIGIVFDKDTK